MATLTPLSFRQGETWQLPLRWLQSDGVTPVDLTGYTARMHLRERYSSTAPALILTTENGRLTLGGALGTIDLLVSADASASVAAKTYVYDLKLVSGGGVVNHLIYGPCDVANEATK